MQKLLLLRLVVIISCISPRNVRFHGRSSRANVFLDVAAHLILGWLVDIRKQLTHTLVFDGSLNHVIVVNRVLILLLLVLHRLKVVLCLRGILSGCLAYLGFVKTTLR